MAGNSAADCGIGTAVPVPELITDTKGYAVSPELPYGSYVVVESTTPENLKTIDPFVVNVENDSREPMQWRVFDDRPFEFLLKIVKKDAQTGNTVLKAGHQKHFLKLSQKHSQKHFLIQNPFYNPVLDLDSYS